MKLEAVKLVRYGKDRYDPGTKFEIDDERHAKLLVASGLAKIAEDGSAEKPERRRRQYKRRDMVVEGQQS